MTRAISSVFNAVILKPSEKLDPTGKVKDINDQYLRPDKGSEPAAQATPTPMPEAPKVEDATAKAEENARKKRVALNSGSKSVYSSPLGLSGQANVARAGLKTKTGE